MNKAYKKLAAGTLSLCMLAGMGSAFAAAVPNQDKSMQLTAKVEAPVPTYTVTIPESTDLGTLSAEQDNSKAYTVSVSKVANLNGGKVKVTAPAGGDLTSGDNTLAYTNDFGTKETDKAADWTGNIKVAAAAVKAAAAGAYTGTVNFTVSYVEPAAPEVPETPETGMDAPAVSVKKLENGYALSVPFQQRSYWSNLTNVTVNGTTYEKAYSWNKPKQYKIVDDVVNLSNSEFTKPVNEVVLTATGYKTLTLQINADDTIAK